MVAVAYLGLDPNEEIWFIYHKDGDKTNDNADNLEVYTGAEADIKRSEMRKKAFKDSPNIRGKAPKIYYLVDTYKEDWFEGTAAEIGEKIGFEAKFIRKHSNGTMINGRWRITDKFSEVWELLDDRTDW